MKKVEVSTVVAHSVGINIWCAKWVSPGSPEGVASKDAASCVRCKAKADRDVRLICDSVGEETAWSTSDGIATKIWSDCKVINTLASVVTGAWCDG